MSVPYSDVYGIFSGLTTDYKHLQLPTDAQDAIMLGWLVLAISSFGACATDLSDRDDMFQQFNQNLSGIEQTILAKLMIVEWMSPKLYSIDLFQNRLTTKDWNSFSPANLLKEVRETHAMAQKNARNMINSYSHSKFDLKDLKV